MKSKNKKLLRRVSEIAVAAMLAAVVGAGCGETAHTHNYEWKSDDTYHWQYCEDDEYTTDKVTHVDENGDNKCDTCGKN